MSAIFDRDHEPPKPDELDSLHTGTKAILSLIPTAGELFTLIVAPPIQRRNEEWQAEIAAAVRRLEERHISPEQLRDNPVFVDALLSASAAVLKTSRQEKREALRNAVINSALPGAPEAAVQQIFIGLVDRFTEWHLRILGLFANPKGWRHTGGREGAPPLGGTTTSLSAVLIQAYPELRDKAWLYELIWDDLKVAGLHASGGMQVAMSTWNTVEKRTTPLGDQFVRFISDPFQP